MRKENICECGLSPFNHALPCKPQHTPTPLRITLVHRLNGYPNYICPNDDDHENHGTFLSMSFVGSNVTKDEQEFFLERVVRAVNSHEALLESCKDMLDALKITGHYEKLGMHTEQMEKAIAQAEGGK